VPSIESWPDGYQPGNSPPGIAKATGHPLRRAPGESRLTGASRETLAIVAYASPTCGARDRGDSAACNARSATRSYGEGMIRIAGRDDTLGRPVLYATTRSSCKLSASKSLRDLPQPITCAPRPQAAEDEEHPMAGP